MRINKANFDIHVEYLTTNDYYMHKIDAVDDMLFIDIFYYLITPNYIGLI